LQELGDTTAHKSMETSSSLKHSLRHFIQLKALDYNDFIFFLSIFARCQCISWTDESHEALVLHKACK